MYLLDCESEWLTLLYRFFITLEPTPSLNGKNTIFGRVVSGDETLRRIAAVDTDMNDRPLEPVLVSRCGELERRKRKAQMLDEPQVQAVSHDRGRRRRSVSGDVEMENSPVPPTRPHQHRRTSDNAVDEGIRGRPRQRSGSRSPSRPLSPPTEEGSSDRSSPAKKHKRKRSPSPSRHANGTSGFGRRRRSLPNQYEQDKSRKTSTEDEDRYKPSPRRDDYRQGVRQRDSGDRYRPSAARRMHRDNDGRLGGGGHDDYDPPIKFKGRGAMKYRDPDRAW